MPCAPALYRCHDTTERGGTSHVQLSRNAVPSIAAASPRSGPGILLGVVALFLGIAVAILAIVAVVLVKTADDARDEAKAATRPATATTDHSAHASAASGAVSLPLQSFAGAVPENADELAKAHVAYDAALPPVPAGDLVKVQMTLKDMVVEVAPGVKYNTWAFDGHGAPGPIVHVREGQTVEMTLKNGGSIPHSIDFHAARIAPNVAFRDVAPGDSFTFRFKAGDPGVFMYHCGTKPVLAHIANGMYGAIVVDPAKPLPKADKEYVLVASEWYLTGDGIDEPASLDMAKARAMTARLDDLQRLREPVRHAPTDREPGRDGPLLRRRRRADARHRTSTSSARSSTAPG